MKLFTRIAQDAGYCTFLQHSIELSENNTNMGIVILHTNDVHCSINADDNSFGYAELAAYRAKLESEGYKTLLVDAGDSIQGDVIGTLSDGSYPLRIMNELCYDLAVPGNHEFDFGMDNFFRLKNNSEFQLGSILFQRSLMGQHFIELNID